MTRETERLFDLFQKAAELNRSRIHSLISKIEGTSILRRIAVWCAALTILLLASVIGPPELIWVLIGASTLAFIDLCALIYLRLIQLPKLHAMRLALEDMSANDERSTEPTLSPPTDTPEPDSKPDEAAKFVELRFGDQYIQFDRCQSQNGSEQHDGYICSGDILVTGDLDLASLPPIKLMIEGDLSVQGNIVQTEDRDMEFNEPILELTVSGNVNAQNLICSNVSLVVHGHTNIERNVLTFGVHGHISLPALTADTLVSFVNEQRWHYYHNAFLNVSEFDVRYFFTDEGESQPPILDWGCLATKLNSKDIDRLVETTFFDLALAGKPLINESVMHALLQEKITVLGHQFENYSQQVSAHRAEYSDAARTLYYKGDILINGDVYSKSFLVDQEYAEFIIDGNLSINGCLHADEETILDVRGDVHVQKLVMPDGCLIATGTIHIEARGVLFSNATLKANKIKAKDLYSLDALVQFAQCEVGLFWHVERQSGHRFTGPYNCPIPLAFSFLDRKVRHRRYFDIDEKKLIAAVTKDQPVVNEIELRSFQDSRLMHLEHSFAPLMQRTQLSEDVYKISNGRLFFGNQVYFYTGTLTLDGDFMVDELFAETPSAKRMKKDGAELGLVIDGDLSVRGDIVLATSGLCVLGDIKADNIIVSDDVNEANPEDYLQDENLTGTLLASGDIQAESCVALGNLSRLNAQSLKTNRLIKLSMAKTNVRSPNTFEQNIECRTLYDHRAAQFDDSQPRLTAGLMKKNKVHWSKLVEAIRAGKEIINND